jgi:hypothetical protein
MQQEIGSTLHGIFRYGTLSHIKGIFNFIKWIFNVPRMCRDIYFYYRDI